MVFGSSNHPIRVYGVVASSAMVLGFIGRVRSRAIQRPQGVGCMGVVEGISPITIVAR